jgi:hypothetical protein
MTNSPLQNNFRVPARFQKFPVYFDGFRELTQGPEAVSFSYLGLRVSRFYFEAFIEILQRIIVSMEFRQNFGPENEGIEVFGVKMECICELHIERGVLRVGLHRCAAAFCRKSQEKDKRFCGTEGLGPAES